MTDTIIVTDAEQRAALAATRSLGRAGYRIVVTSRHRYPLAAASRFAARFERVPDPLGDPADYIDAIASLVSAEHARLVLPIAEPSILPILEHRQRLAPAVVPFPPYEQFLRLSNKVELTQVAPRFGIAVPAQVEVRDAAEEVSSLNYPIVIKPARSVAGSPGDRVKLTVGYARSDDELHALLHSLPQAAFPVLLQERIVGPGVGLFLLRWEGRTIATMAHRRIREKPPSGGVSVMRATIPAPPELVERSEQLLDHFGWSGVAMVEYKLGQADLPYLMEVNGRFWGSLQLAIDAGVDFPRLLVSAALGERVVPVTGYRMVRSRWWWGDVDHLIARWTRSSIADGQLATRARTTFDVLMPLQAGCREEIFRWTDPRPFLRETREWFRDLRN